MDTDQNIPFGRHGGDKVAFDDESFVVASFIRRLHCCGERSRITSGKIRYATPDTSMGVSRNRRRQGWRNWVE